MKMKSYIILIVLLSLSCGSNSQIPDTTTHAAKIHTSKFCDSIDKYIISVEFKNGYTYLKVGFVGQDTNKCDFLFDTGAKILLIDSALMVQNKLPIKIGKQTQLTNLDGVMTKAYNSIIDKNSPVRMLIGRDTISIFECVITNGQNTFPMCYFGQDKIVNINVKDRYIALLDSLQYKVNEIHYQREYYTNMPLIDSTIEIEKDGVKVSLKGTFGVDLGCPAALMLKTDFIGKHKNIKVSKILYRTQFVNSFSYSTIIDDAQIGFCNTKFVNKIDISKSFTSIKQTSYLEGILGQDFLLNYDIAIDAKLQKIYFSPLNTATGTDNNPFYDKWGVNIEYDFHDNDAQKVKSAVISLVVTGRYGYNRGVFPGDFVIEVDNKPIDFSVTREAISKILKNCNSLTVRTAKGKIIHLE